MSNNAFLFATSGQELSLAPRDAVHLLRVGPNMIPILWVGAFRVSDLVDVVREDLEIVQLFATKTRALAAWRAFAAGLRSSPEIVERWDVVMTSFERCLVEAPGEGLQLDDYELQCMVEPEENKEWITTCLAFVADVAEGRLSGNEILKSNGALELVDQAQVDLNHWTANPTWEACLSGFREQ